MEHSDSVLPVVVVRLRKMLGLVQVFQLFSKAQVDVCLKTNQQIMSRLTSTSDKNNWPEVASNHANLSLGCLDAVRGPLQKWSVEKSS